MAEPPGAGTRAGRINPPIDLGQLLRSDFWAWKMPFTEQHNQAATMLQPVGGMDRIPQAFAGVLGGTVVYNAEVVRMRRTDVGARVEWRSRATGEVQALEAAHVICTAPLPVLAGLDADFSPELKSALGQVYYVPAVKVALQADRRFWEEDLAIYGGITWTSQDITQIWYPSSGFHARNGILVGAYLWSEGGGRAFASLSPEARVARAITSGEKIHPGYAGQVSRGVSIAWSKVPFALGAWAEFTGERRTLYPVLVKPDGPYHLAGEHLSHINGWQEGAVRSAHLAIADIAARVRAKRI
jgi:monoamine oxidase